MSRNYGHSFIQNLNGDFTFLYPGDIFFILFPCFSSRVPGLVFFDLANANIRLLGEKCFEFDTTLSED